LVDADLVAGDGSGVTLDGQRAYDESEPVERRLRVSTNGSVEPISVAEGRLIAEAAYQRVQRRTSGVTWLDGGFVEAARLLKTLDEDIEAVAALIAEIGAVHATDDPKIAELARLISAEHPTEKLLIFSEYRDTAEYVHAGCAAGGSRTWVS